MGGHALFGRLGTQGWSSVLFPRGSCVKHAHAYHHEGITSLESSAQARYRTVLDSRYDRFWSKSLHVMFNVQIFTTQDGQVDEHD